MTCKTSTFYPSEDGDEEDHDNDDEYMGCGWIGNGEEEGE